MCSTSAPLPEKICFKNVLLQTILSSLYFHRKTGGTIKIIFSEQFFQDIRRHPFCPIKFVRQI